MALSQLLIGCIEDRIGRLGQCDVCCVVCCEVVPQLPDAAKQGRVRYTLCGKRFQLLNKLGDSVRVNPLARGQISKSADNLDVQKVWNDERIVTPR